MNEQIISIGDVMTGLREKEMLDDSRYEAITKYLESAPKSEPPTPWFIKIMIAIGAWFSAWFLVFFLFISELIDWKNSGTAVIWGVLFIGMALGITFLSRHLFLSQLTLALSAAGRILILIGLFDHGELPAMFGVTGLLCVLLYPLYRDPIHRFLSCALFLVITVIFILDSTVHHWLHVTVLIVMGGLALLLYSKRLTRYWQPLFYALALTLPIMLFLTLIPKEDLNTSWWPTNALIALGLFFLTRWILLSEGSGKTGKEPLSLSLLITLLLSALSAPGLLSAVGLLILGYWLRLKPLTGIGLTFIPVYIIIFYSNINMPLDLKSGLMTGSGLVLLGLRYYLIQKPWFHGEGK